MRWNAERLGVKEDYRQGEITFDSGHRMEMDVFVPDLKLAFEYQGQQHFNDLYLFGPQVAHRRT